MAKRVVATPFLPGARSPYFGRLALQRTLPPLKHPKTLLTSLDNKVAIFYNGNEFYQELWRCIDEAKKSIWLESYQLDRDRIGTRTLQKLTEAAKRGVHVLLVVDGVGSGELAPGQLEPFRCAGGEAIYFNSIAIRREENAKRIPRHHVLHRSHRKVAIFDETVGFCGGMNITEGYAEKSFYGKGTFRDTHLRMMGPVVGDLQEVFLHTVKEYHQGLASLPCPRKRNFYLDILPVARTRERAYTHFFPEPLDMPDVSKPNPRVDIPGVVVQLMYRDTLGKQTEYHKAVCLSLSTANKNVFITTPYFVPSPEMRKELLSAAERGIDVRVLTSGSTDVPIARFSSRIMHDILRRAGVRIYELQPKTLHAKSVTVDGESGAVSTFNADYMSRFRNLEVCVWMRSPGVAKSLERQFLKDLKSPGTLEISLYSDEHSFLERLCYRAAYGMYRNMIRVPSYGSLHGRSSQAPRTTLRARFAALIRRKFEERRQRIEATRKRRAEEHKARYK